MKRLIFLSTLLIFAIASTAQPLLIPKGIKASGRIISPTEVSYLDSLSGPIEKTFLKVSDGVLGSTLYYEKDTIDDKLSKKLNVYQPVITNGTANTLPVGTNTTGLATTAFSIANGNDYFHNLVKLGSDAKAIPITFTPYAIGTATLTDNTMNLTLVYIEAPCTITGIRFPITTAGNYVSDNYNGVGVYSLNATSYNSLLGSTTNDTSEPNIFEATANTIVTKSFSSPIVVSQPMWIGVAFLYNSSSQTTAPAISGVGNTVPITYSNTFTGTPFHICASGNFASSTLPSSVAISTTLRTGSAPLFILY